MCYKRSQYLITTIIVILCTLSYAQVPPQDQCQWINANEPPQCPETIGPPCPPCIINTASDYSTGDNVIISSSTKESIESYMMEYINFWLKTYPPSKIIPRTGSASADIVSGSAGRSLMFLRMYNYTQNITYLNIASEYMQTAIYCLNKTTTNAPSYFSGNTGVYIIAAQIAKFQNNSENIQKYLNEISYIFEDVQNAININASYSLKYKFDMKDGVIMSGLGGLLYAGMLIDEYFGINAIDNLNEYITNISHYLIDIGLQKAKLYNINYLIYEMPFSHGTNDCYLSGAADGTGGVIKMLLEAYNRGYVTDLMNDTKYYNAITNTLNWEISIQLNNGNMPTYSSNMKTICSPTWVGNDSDARVQWCNGAPSFIDTYSLAAIVYDSINQTQLAETYLNHSLLAFNSTWNRGLLIKGLMLCHGVGGNTYTLLHLYRNLEIISKTNSILNKKFDIQHLMNQSLWRGIQFIKFTLNETNLNALRTNDSNEDYSMWLGSYGIVTLYIQAIQDNWPQKQPTCMIAWDFCGV